MSDPDDDRVDAPLDEWVDGTGREETSAGSDCESLAADAEPGESRSTDSAARRPSFADALAPELPEAEAELVALGVELLATLEHDTLTVKEAVDRVETITKEPRLTREILDAAEAAGAIERDGETVTPRRGTHVSFGADVVVREGEFDCRRCGTTLTEGHFLQLDAGELGAFGSSCIRKVTGRE